MRTHWRQCGSAVKAFSSLMVDFVVVQTSICHMMSRQLSKSGHRPLHELYDTDDCWMLRSAGPLPSVAPIRPAAERPPQQQQLSPLERVLRLKKRARRHHKMMVYFYFLELFRYLLIDLLSLDTFQDYQLLDCFILGRFRFFGRTNKISTRIVFVFMLLFALYRFLVFNVYIPPFKFYALEFLMYDHKQVLLEEMRSKGRGGQCADAMWLERRLGLRGPADRASNLHLNPVFYLKSPFHLVEERAGSRPKPAESEEWILRPNRSSRCWRFLDAYTQCLIYGSLAAMVVWISLVYRTIGGSITTDLGFELGYSSCASWLQRRQRSANGSWPEAGAPRAYGWIYAAPPLLAGQMEIDLIPAIIPFSLADLHSHNAYHTARILLDILVNNCWYIEFMLTVVCVSYVMFMSSLDVILNAAEIHRRLSAIVAKLGRRRSERQLTDSRLLATLHDGSVEARHTQTRYRERAAALKGAQRWRKESEDEIAAIQAVLTDHFNLVRGYNQFVSFALTLILGTWCLYSLVLCLWIGSVRSSAVEFEFLITEIGGTCIALIFFSGAAVARCLNHRLYALIACAMALDDDHSARKLRWTNLVKFYTPRPNYCFTLLGFAEISSLFCLEFVFWIASAYIVLAKFFYTTTRE